MPPKRKAPADAPEAPRASKRQTTAAAKITGAPKNAAAPKAAPKKTAAPKPAAPKKTAAPKPVAPKKAAAPKPKVVEEKAEPAPKKHKFGVTINQAPTRRLNIWVFGEGSQGELGLGHLTKNGKTPTDVTRPRLNHLLDATTVGVVMAAAGGMHAAAITYDNRILTWGVNDQGALGRDTIDRRTQEQKDAEEDEDEVGLNPEECTPGQVLASHFPQGTVFTNICCSDSATFVVTQDGNVYGWGTFRAAEGVLGFRPDRLIEYYPVVIPELKKIVSVTAGANHIMAKNDKGDVLAWGCGQQNQLGRRVVERTRTGGLIPREFGLPRGKISFVNSGENHSFAINTKADKVYAWGLNNYGQTGMPEDVGKSNAVVPQPTEVPALTGEEIVQIAGGNHHTIALTKKGGVLAWGRADSGALGVDLDTIPQNKIVFHEGAPRLVEDPVVVPGIEGSFIASGTDNSFAVTTDGRVYSWGFSENSQTGQGNVGIVKIATLIDNSAVRGKKITWAGAGGQFSMLAGPADV